MEKEVNHSNYSVSFRELIKNDEHIQKIIEQNGVLGHGFSGWTNVRKFITPLIDKDGSFLDIGCGNGFLIRCLEEWSGHCLIPYGIDVNRACIEACKQMFPTYAANFRVMKMKGFKKFPSGLTKDFTYVYWAVWDNADLSDRSFASKIELLLARVKPDGKLLLAFYDLNMLGKIESKLSSWPFMIHQRVRGPTHDTVFCIEKN